jgi:hypothetical protein
MCEVIRNLVEGISNDVSEVEGTLWDDGQLLYTTSTYVHDFKRFGRIVIAVG